MNDPLVCTETGCSNPSTGWGLCSYHMTKGDLHVIRTDHPTWVFCVPAKCPECDPQPQYLLPNGFCSRHTPDR